MKKHLMTITIALASFYAQGQNLQQVTENGNSTTKNLYVGISEATAISDGAVPQKLNLAGKLKFLGLPNEFTFGLDANQPTIYRSGINTAGYPFNNYDNLILQAGVQNRDIVFVTGSTPSIKMSITGIGNVGIGTSDTKGYKLAVNGKIRTQEIKVEVANWPDYVFAKDYKLPSLGEMEQHIKDKGYLPGIPSAEEVRNNGVDLGEMNAKLLKKIEELTLHLIEKEHKDEQLQVELKEQKSIVLKLITRLDLLENKTK
ncbi:hypothetical protein [Pedobacter sp. B4-66]|uniref:hypothetical protein n=1 Tax=Pedobacter sp. B4-66 TaxID=2817280 RepID=UPI001BDA6EB8|nr:hypothetical protein [Pedobacter sp. B4-66]